MSPHGTFWTRTASAIILAGFQFLATFVNSAEPDPLRLGREVEPLTQAMDLELDPGKDGYTGVARVELQFHVATNAFRFHARQLKSISGQLDGLELKLTHGEGDLVTAATTHPVSKGRHLLVLRFENDYNRDGTGLYKVEKGGKAYLFTQMEATFARGSFPCWDEPDFKIPWRFTVTAPAGVEVIGNMPPAEKTVEGDRQKVAFGRTPPMPVYLVAFAVGPLDSMPIPGQVVPGRIYTTQGQTNLAAVAAKETQALLGALEEYFGIPYPYPKLDHIAVPEFLFGAMENVGAITYNDALLLTDPANMSYDTHRFIVMVIAHELAHMWFGNLVTMNWWDDLWLNEAFATWISLKVGGQVRPELRFDVMAHEFVSEAKRTDTQPSVKAIRRHFRGDDNIMEAVDALTYSKGQAILGMIEGWIGEEKFRQALTQYFHKHLWGNAQADDLWAAFAQTGDPALVEALRRFIEQPGLPALSFTPMAGNRLRISQKRYRTVTGGKAADQTWHVPVVIRFGSGGREQKARVLLTGTEQVFDVPGLDAAAWIYPNSGETGYYNWTMPGEHSARLALHAIGVLSLTERLGLLQATALSVESGDTSAADALRVALPFLDDPEPQVRQAAAASVASAYETYLTSEDRSMAAPALRRILRPVLDAIGRERKPDEPRTVDPLRASLLTALGTHGQDSDIIKFCRSEASRQLKDPRSVDAGIAQAVLDVASWNGDKEWAAQLKQAFEKVEASDLRARFLTAMGKFRNPELARAAMDYSLTDAVPPTDVQVLQGNTSDLAGLRLEWLMKNYDALKSKVSEDTLPFWVTILSGAEPEILEKGRAFFLDPARKNKLTEVELTKIVEASELRYELRKRNRAAVTRLFQQLSTQ